MAEEVQPQPVLETKKPWLSKTLWTNFLVTGLAFVPGAKEWLGSHPDVLPLTFLVLNTFLRFITKDKLSFGD